MIVTSQVPAPVVVTDLPLPVTASELMRFGRFRDQRDSTRRVVETIVADNLHLVRPALLYSWVLVDGSDDGIVLHTGSPSSRVSLTMGCAGDFLRRAERVLAAVYTVGPALEDKAGRLAAAGRAFDAYLLQLLGLVALARIEEAVTAAAEREAMAQRWGTGPLLSPGSVHGWGLEQQGVFCAMLPLHQIGVRIGSDAVLQPFNSISCCIPVGPSYTDSQVRSSCDLCTGNRTCRYRRQVH